MQITADPVQLAQLPQLPQSEMKTVQLKVPRQIWKSLKMQSVDMEVDLGDLVTAILTAHANSTKYATEN